MTSADSDDVARDVVNIVREVCGQPVDPAPHSSLAADLGFDSLRTLEFVAELEDRFGITVPVDAVPRIRTVGEAVTCVRTLLAEHVTP